MDAHLYVGRPSHRSSISKNIFLLFKIERKSMYAIYARPGDVSKQGAARPGPNKTLMHNELNKSTHHLKTNIV